jgi:outer membrane receptor for ferrienterochelin and colicin
MRVDTNHSGRIMIHSIVHRSTLVATLLAGTAIATPAQAQHNAVADQAMAAQQEPDKTQVADGDDIVVTGRAGTSRQRKVETSYAISTISDQDLRIRAPIGVAEALKQVPGFYSAPTSGEVAGGVRVRGIPSDGYQTVALLEDGIPIQGDPGLGWLNGDQSLRIDQSVERIEVVRGGPSAIFYSNALSSVVQFSAKVGFENSLVGGPFISFCRG